MSDCEVIEISDTDSVQIISATDSSMYSPTVAAEPSTRTVTESKVFTPTKRPPSPFSSR